MVFFVGIFETLLQISRQIRNVERRSIGQFIEKGREQHESNQKGKPQSKQITGKECFGSKVMISKSNRGGTNKREPISISPGQIRIETTALISDHLIGNDQHPQNPKRTPNKHQQGSMDTSEFEPSKGIINNVSSDTAGGGENPSEKQNRDES